MPKSTTPASAVLEQLQAAYGPVTTALDFTSAYQLAVATILAAQCTDVRVNMVTPAFFEAWPDPTALASASEADVQAVIASINFFRNKARNLIAFAQAVCTNYAGVVPQALDDLTSLPGIGRKTANVVRAYAYGLPGVVVDTHCGRLARRLGWTEETDAVKVEHALEALLPEAWWVDGCQLLVAHGRAICKAQRPACDRCAVAALCPSAGTF